MALLLSLSPILRAQEVLRPDAHAPIGVMGDHTHKKGEIMFSYRFMRMSMKDNRIGTDDVSLEEIATSVPNLFFGIEGQPPTLRVVPTQMIMNMHMFGAMYAPSDKVTLMVMAMYLNSDMDHIAFQGGMGTNRLGEFTTASSGFGDTKLSALIRLTEHVHATVGVSVPTGTIENDDDVLTPMNMTSTLRLPYPMQIGSGTLDFLPALTYVNHSEKFSWGTQASVVLRLGENENDFRYGHQLNANIWSSYVLTKWLSSSLRLASYNIGEIEGQDPMIVAPVQTANPEFQGGSRIDLGIGLNVIGQGGWLQHQRLAAEFALPVYQDLNGPQLMTNNVLTLGWQYAF